jgi:hypothetical protein
MRKVDFGAKFAASMHQLAREDAGGTGVLTLAGANCGASDASFRGLDCEGRDYVFMALLRKTFVAFILENPG